jgi:hypothetical protein
MMEKWKNYDSAENDEKYMGNWWEIDEKVIGYSQSKIEGVSPACLGRLKSTLSNGAPE